MRDYDFSNEDDVRRYQEDMEVLRLFERDRYFLQCKLDELMEEDAMVRLARLNRH